MMEKTLCEFLVVIGGCLQVTVIALILGAAAAGLDWLVGWLRRGQFSASLCDLLHRMTLLVAVIDCCLILAYAGAHAWEARPAAHCHVTPAVAAVEQ